MELNFIKYLSMGYHAEKNSKEGLDCLIDFNEKLSLVKNKKELENLVTEYERRIKKLENKYYLAWLTAGTFLPAFAIDNFYGASAYILGVFGLQLSDWTRRVIKFKTENGLVEEKWTSYYPYREKFKNKVKLISESNMYLERK